MKRREQLRHIRELLPTEVELWLLADIARLEKALEEARIDHACGEFCQISNEGICNCTAELHNAAIDRALEGDDNV
jgi:hypothetical protein